MKRLVAVLTLIFALSFPVLAGHVPVNGAYCSPCDNSACLCDSGEQPINPLVLDYQQESPFDYSAEVMLLLVLAVMVLKLKE